MNRGNLENFSLSAIPRSRDRIPLLSLIYTLSIRAYITKRAKSSTPPLLFLVSLSLSLSNFSNFLIFYAILTWSIDESKQTRTINWQIGTIALSSNRTSNIILIFETKNRRKRIRSRTYSNLLTSRRGKVGQVGKFAGHPFLLRIRKYISSSRDLLLFLGRSPLGNGKTRGV